MYNRQPVLPIDIQYNLNANNDAKFEYPFNKEIFNTMLSATLSLKQKALRQKAHQKPGKNIMKAQNKQQRDYNQRHTLPTQSTI